MKLNGPDKTHYMPVNLLLKDVKDKSYWGLTWLDYREIDRIDRFDIKGNIIITMKKGNVYYPKDNEYFRNLEKVFYLHL